MDIALPDKFSFDAAKWLAWKQRFERFRAASDLCNKAGERKVAMLAYAMGEKAEDIFASFKLSADGSKKYNIVLQKFENHFIAKKNKKVRKVKFQ